MARNSLLCADVPLRNYSLTVRNLGRLIRLQCYVQIRQESAAGKSNIVSAAADADTDVLMHSLQLMAPSSGA